KQQKILFGAFLALFGIALTISFASYFFTWQADQSSIETFTNRSVASQNLLNKFGALMSNFFVYKGFGVATFIFSGLLILTGGALFLSFPLSRLKKTWFWGLLFMIWLSITLGFFWKQASLLPGVVGFEVNLFLQDFLGKTGTLLLLLFVFVSYLVVRLKVTPSNIIHYFKSKKKAITEEFTAEQPVKQPTPTKIENEEEEVTVDFDSQPSATVEEKKEEPKPVKKTIEE